MKGQTPIWKYLLDFKISIVFFQIEPTGCLIQKIIRLFEKCIRIQNWWCFSYIPVSWIGSKLKRNARRTNSEITKLNGMRDSVRLKWMPWRRNNNCQPPYPCVRVSFYGSSFLSLWNSSLDLNAETTKNPRKFSSWKMDTANNREYCKYMKAFLHTVKMLSANKQVWSLVCMATSFMNLFNWSIVYFILSSSQSISNHCSPALTVV